MRSDSPPTSAFAALPTGLPNELMPFERPLVDGEDPRIYDELFCRFAAAVEPRDAIEWLWLKDLVDVSWEAQRTKELQARLFSAWRQEAMRVLIVNCIDGGSVVSPSAAARHAAEKWSSTGTRGERAMKKFLAQYDQNPDLVHSLVFAAHSDSLERFDNKISAAHQRRDKTIQEIERRSCDRADRFRRAANDILDHDPAPANATPAATYPSD